MSAGRLHEASSNGRPRWMVAHDRIRLTGRLIRPRPLGPPRRLSVSKGRHIGDSSVSTRGLQRRVSGSLPVAEPQISEEQVIDAFADMPCPAVVRRITDRQQRESKRRATALGREVEDDLIVGSGGPKRRPDDSRRTLRLDHSRRQLVRKESEPRSRSVASRLNEITPHDVRRRREVSRPMAVFDHASTYPAEQSVISAACTEFAGSRRWVLSLTAPLRRRGHPHRTSSQEAS
jgi:hypothetical protein